MPDVHRTPHFLPFFLDITRLKTGLSLVWCPKLKNSQTSVKNKRQVSPFDSRANRTEHNSLGTDKSPLRSSKRKKKLNNRMTGTFFHLHNGVRFCSLWQKRNPNRHQQMSLKQCQSYPTLSNQLRTHFQEGMKDPVLRSPCSQIPHWQWAHRVTGRVRKKWHERTHWTWWGCTDKIK